MFAEPMDIGGADSAEDGRSELSQLLQIHKLGHIEVLFGDLGVFRLEDITSEVIERITPRLRTGLDKSRFKKIIPVIEERIVALKAEDADELIRWYDDNTAEGALHERLKGVKQSIHAQNEILSMGTEIRVTPRAMEIIYRSKSALQEEAEELKAAISECRNKGEYVFPKPTRRSLFRSRRIASRGKISFSESVSCVGEEGTLTHTCLSSAPSAHYKDEHLDAKRAKGEAMS